MTETPTNDAFLDGRVWLRQPRGGYRAGVDPVLLAAAIPAKAGQSVLDLGCGVGAAALCLAARCPGLDVVGIERHPAYAGLAVLNAEANGEAMNVYEADLSALPASLRTRQFDHVIANPPYFAAAGRKPAPDAAREAARGEDTPLEVWIDVAARRLAPRGYLHIILHAERLADLLSAVRGRLGSIEILPIAAREGRRAQLVILRARKEGRAPLRLLAPLILHEGDRHIRDGDDYRPEIRAVLRDAAPLPWPGGPSAQDPTDR